MYNTCTPAQPVSLDRCSLPACTDHQCKDREGDKHPAKFPCLLRGGGTKSLSTASKSLLAALPLGKRRLFQRTRCVTITCRRALCAPSVRPALTFLRGTVEAGRPLITRWQRRRRSRFAGSTRPARHANHMKRWRSQYAATSVQQKLRVQSHQHSAPPGCIAIHSRSTAIVARKMQRLVFEQPLFQSAHASP